MDFEYIDRLVNDETAIIYVRTMDGRYCWVNDVYGEELPFTREEVVGHTNSELFGEEAAKNWQIADSLVGITGEPITTVEDMFDTRTNRWRKFVATKLRVEHDGVPYIVGISVEIKGAAAVEYLTKLGNLRARLIARLKPEEVNDSE